MSPATALSGAHSVPSNTVEPEWIAVLRAAIHKRGMPAMVLELAYSRTSLSLVLKGQYTGDPKHIEAKVRDVLMSADVECPLIGAMPRARCLQHQASATEAVFTNPFRAALFRTCPTCPNNRTPIL